MLFQTEPFDIRVVPVNSKSQLHKVPTRWLRTPLFKNRPANGRKSMSPDRSGGNFNYLQQNCMISSHIEKVQNLFKLVQRIESPNEPTRRDESPTHRFGKANLLEAHFVQPAHEDELRNLFKRLTRMSYETCGISLAR